MGPCKKPSTSSGVALPLPKEKAVETLWPTMAHLYRWDPSSIKSVSKQISEINKCKMGRGQLGAERWGAAESWVGQGGDVMRGSALRDSRAAAAAAQRRGTAWFGRNRGRLGCVQQRSGNSGGGRATHGPSLLYAPVYEEAVQEGCLAAAGGQAGAHPPASPCLQTSADCADYFSIVLQ
jgi:hypothetical protein